VPDGSGTAGRFLRVRVSADAPGRTEQRLLNQLRTRCRACGRSAPGPSWPGRPVLDCLRHVGESEAMGMSTAARPWGTSSGEEELPRLSSATARPRGPGRRAGPVQIRPTSPAGPPRQGPPAADPGSVGRNTEIGHRSSEQFPGAARANGKPRLRTSGAGRHGQQSDSRARRRQAQPQAPQAVVLPDTGPGPWKGCSPRDLCPTGPVRVFGGSRRSWRVPVRTTRAAFV